LLLRAEIPEFPEKKVLSEVPRRRSGILFLPVWLSCPSLLWFHSSGILFLPVYLWCRVLLWGAGSQQCPPVRAVLR
jgi:hypothetical protein